MLTSLAAFPGGAPADLIDAVQPRELGSHRELVKALDGLVQRSLVQLEDSVSGGHYRLLEPMRVAALSRLDHGARPRPRHSSRRGGRHIGPSRASGGCSRATKPPPSTTLIGCSRACAPPSTTTSSTTRTERRKCSSPSTSSASCGCASRCTTWTESLLERGGLSARTESAVLALSGIAGFNRGDLGSGAPPGRAEFGGRPSTPGSPVCLRPLRADLGYGFNCEFDRAQQPLHGGHGVVQDQPK